MRSRFMAVLTALCLLCISPALGEGLFPTAAELGLDAGTRLGKMTPSLAEALGRYPDSEFPGADGGSVQMFHGMTGEEFDLYSAYLKDRGAALKDRRSTENTFSAEILCDGLTVTFTYEFLSQEATVTYPGPKGDEWLAEIRSLIGTAQSQKEAGRIDDAAQTLLEVPDYERFAPAALLKDDPAFAAIVREKRTEPFKKVGAVVTFGRFPQQESGEDRTPISWLVLDHDEKNGRALLLSRQGLTAMRYHEKRTEVTWETCSLRAWLNGSFIDTAFNAGERQAILTTKVDNSAAQSYASVSAPGGADTQDSVFLLSYGEANKYLGVTRVGGGENAAASPTAYAVSQGAHSFARTAADGLAAGRWWLRSPGNNNKHAACISSAGAVETGAVNMRIILVRPALWIDLNAY